MAQKSDRLCVLKTDGLENNHQLTCTSGNAWEGKDAKAEHVSFPSSKPVIPTSPPGYLSTHPFGIFKSDSCWD